MVHQDSVDDDDGLIQNTDLLKKYRQAEPEPSMPPPPVPSSNGKGKGRSVTVADEDDEEAGHAEGTSTYQSIE